MKPMKKKIVGGSACFTCASHQLTARRRSAVGVEAAIAGSLMFYSPRIWPGNRVIVTTEVPRSVFRFEHSLLTYVNFVGETCFVRFGSKLP